MTDDDGADDAPEGQDEDEGEGEDAEPVTVEGLESRLDDAAEAIEAAETEADLDEVESTLDAVAEDLDAADLPDSESEDEEAPAEALADRLDGLREDLEAARGPYAADAVETVEAAIATVEDTRWTETGEGEVADAVRTFVDAANEALDADVAVEGDGPASLVGTLEAVVETVEAADLDPDEDDETVAALVEAADGLTTGLADAEGWDDLEIREQLEAQGYYDVLGHYKDFPPEWAALKEHEQQGNVEMVLLAYDAFDSDFMERHCIEALTRMNDQRAFDEMHQLASKRDRSGIEAIGTMAAEDAVDTLLEYVDTDSDPQLQKATFRALGEIGSEEATGPLANKLVMENDNVRPYAARALGMIGDTRAVEPLAETLADDESDSVRAAAAWALRQIGTREALEAAAEYTDARAYIVQHEAEQAAAALAADEPDSAVEA